MPILTQDIKLLKSAVMADTPEGGGAMTGTSVIDGQSNNLFPDTSAMDRAFGRVNARKVFGVAHTDDTDTLMGAHAIITQAPADPLVHCSLLKTAGWADTRDTAKDSIEKYLVKGPRIAYRLYGTHYAGSLQINLISLVGGTAPSGGDAVVLVNPDGQEQYVRILRAALSVQTVAVIEGSNTVLLKADIATCDIGNVLDFDFLGPPATRAGLNESLWAQMYSTNVAGGARFYGIKPLVSPGVPGDYSVLADGGIYTPIVPAATVESPLVDQYPLTLRQSLSRTASRSVNLPSVALTLSPGKVLTLPTVAEPGSVAINHGGTLFGDNGAGLLKQGTNEVGVISYSDKTITMNAGAPNYGNQSCVVSYRPATPAGAATHSNMLTITTANQGLVFTSVFEPPPAPGTFTVSYMAQGRWYDLTDNANGKLSGAESAYGIGTVNYGTGSVGITLGAIPDVGSAILYQWGDAAVASVFDSSKVPARLSTKITVSPKADPATLQMNWSRGGVSYQALCGADGVLTGHATGKILSGDIDFQPSYFPDTAVALQWNKTPTGSGAMTNNGGGSYTLTDVPVVAGSVSISVLTFAQSGFDFASAINVVDNLAGSLISTTVGSIGQTVGTINYTTGAITIAGTVAMDVFEHVIQNYEIVAGQQRFYEWRAPRSAHVVALTNGTVTTVAYRVAGAATPETLSVTPTDWTLALPLLTGQKLRTTGLMFEVNSEVYHTASGSVERGWNINTAASTASAGAVTDSGVVTLTSLPAAGTNTVSLVNAGLDMSSGLTVGQGMFRIASAPVKVGVFQIQAGALVGSANAGGVISGGGWGGTVDFQRGIVAWNRTNTVWADWGAWQALNPIAASELSYNAVFLQYLPLDATLLGLDTVRLPLDGKVPIYRPGDLVVVHNTLTTQLTNPLTKGTVYPLGRERIASVRVKDVLGVVVPSSLYTTDLNPGTLTVSVGSDITPYSQPFTVEHRIEDMLVCSVADISGQIKTLSSLTHNFPANTSFVSSALPFGDLFARPFGYLEQSTWTGAWSDVLIGTAPLANFNEGQYPVVCTNRGAITERWALIFNNTTTFHVVGESVGDLGTFSMVSAAAPINPATGAPYFTLPALGWGNGWATGNVLRFNTAACGAPFWPIRTVLQGPASLDSDVFSIAFRGDVDRP